MRPLRAEILLPVVIVLAAAALAVSEFMIAFEFTPPGGEPLREVSGADRHDFSNLVLAVAAVVAMGIAVATGARPAAFAVAGIGGVTLLLFLIIDLPDAGKLGDLSDPLRGLANVRAEPQSGFWLQAVGAVSLALAGGAFATFRSEQLQSWRRRIDRRGTTETEGEPVDQAAATATANPGRRSSDRGAPPAGSQIDLPERRTGGDRRRPTAAGPKPANGKKGGNGKKSGRRRLSSLLRR